MRPVVFEFGDFRLDLSNHLLSRRDGTPVPLTSRVFDTLAFMVEHHGSVLDKERLMEAVWSDSIVEENNLAQSISKLRQVLGEKPGTHRFIVTVPGRGYRFAADVTVRDSMPEDAQSSSEKSETQAVQTPTKPAEPATKPKVSPAWSFPRGAVIAALVILALGAGILLLHSRKEPPAADPTPPEKSIAVLPFENLSDDRENAYFAAGIQDDVLTSLAQIRELKVISHTSVMAFQTPGGRNIREIGQALGVANVLEGSVRRAGNRVLVNVQLIDVRKDQHLWAERYDRTVADSIGLQGELATEIAGALKAKLAPEEKARLATKPTTNPEAYLLYLRAMELSRTAASKEDAFATEELFAKAIELDPTFALAIARRSMWNVRMYMVGRRPENKAAALALAAQALQLSPDLPEAHLALGLCFYRIEKNYDAALREFSSAAAASAMEPDVLDYTAAIYCRQGRWREGLASYDRAQEMDPRQPHAGGPWTRAMLRDWPGAVAGFQRLLTIAPNDIDIVMGYANISVQQSGDFAIARKLLASIPPGLHGAPGQPSMIDVALTQIRWDIEMLARDYAAAEQVLADYKGEHFMEEPLGGVKSYNAAQTALARGDVDSARSLFEQARPLYEGNAHEHPDDAQSHALLGLLYAYLGRKDDAIRESLRAVELVPESKDAQGGPGYAANLALVYARTGEIDRAITLIERLLTTPNGIILTNLRLSWEWDPLRSDPRFQKILAGPEPKTVY